MLNNKVIIQLIIHKLLFYLTFFLIKPDFLKDLQFYF